MKPKLIIIRGNSASGKSTIAKRLQLELGYGTMLVPQDVLRREIVRVKDEPNNPAIDLIKTTALYGKDIGYNVIIEGILNTDKYGDMLCELMREFGEHVCTYYLDISFEEALRRHNLKPVANEYGEKELREWWREKDYLGVQRESILTETMTEDMVIKKVLKDIKAAEIPSKSKKVQPLTSKSKKVQPLTG